MVIDALAARARARGGRETPDAWAAEARLGNEDVVLVKPLSFMNRSGGPVAQALAERGASPADLVVVIDDVALELGTLRVRERGGPGGPTRRRPLPHGPGAGGGAPGR